MVKALVFFRLLMNRPLSPNLLHRFHLAGFELEGRDILIDDYRIRAVVQGSTPAPCEMVPSKGKPIASSTTKAYFETGWEEVPVYKFEDLEPGHEIPGPSIIVQSISTIVLETECNAVVTSDGDLDITVSQAKKKVDNDETGSIHSADGDVEMAEAEVEEDPVQLSIFSHRFMGIAEQMGRTLARTAISVNIKERLVSVREKNMDMNWPFALSYYPQLS